MYKKLFLVFVLSTMFMFPQISSVSGSQGRLREDSICEKNGVYYGEHGDGHWHKAVQRSGRWYAVGDSLGKTSPC